MWDPATSPLGPASWLQPGPALAGGEICRVKQRMEDWWPLCFEGLLLNKNFTFAPHFTRNGYQKIRTETTALLRI